MSKITDTEVVRAELAQLILNGLAQKTGGSISEGAVETPQGFRITLGLQGFAEHEGVL